MFIRSTQYEVKPGHFDQAVEVFRTKVFPQLEREPGFMRVLVTGDATSGKGIVYTLWQKEEHAHRYETSGEATRLLRPFAELFVRAPKVRGYPVLFDREF
jgi:heme-degrading monooxygenase HmoA